MKARSILILASLAAVVAAQADNKVKVSLTSGQVNTYSTKSISSIDFMSGNNFEINFSDGTQTMRYADNVDEISFVKMPDEVSGGVQITAARGWYESALVEWQAVSGATSYNVYCKPVGGVYEQIDAELVRQTKSGYRADALGLRSGDYQLMVVPTHGGIEMTDAASETAALSVSAFDRSGYAHWNYDEGVGAYDNDGTLKDGAIVIYVTDANKDEVTVPGYESCGKGLGWILNNTQYSKSGSNTYTSNASKLGIYPITKEHPLCIRFIGKVTTPDGCTAYNSTDNGGSVGDNGHLARMKDARNLTLEGVGTDAVIYGWGFHFIASDGSGEYGKNFEARNLTFDDYPEDAIGMEGVQASDAVTSDLSASVEHCWVHHCSFMQGYCANPAESDKAEGDGSCDFKRGQYFTLSYCYFEYGHKTNLIGSSDKSLQFNISFHHNIWKNCASRVPLLRNANFHFYNNYVFGDMTDSKASLSYVASCRANSYRYSEHNYFDGCKNVCQITSGGVSKSFGDVYYACIEDNDAVIAKSRTEAVSSNCQFQARKINFANFDTNAKLFYYDDAKKRTDAYITDAVTARRECLMYSGVQKAVPVSNTSMNVNAVSGSIDLSSCSFAPTMGTSGRGITFANYTAKSGKFKGQGITFCIDRSAKVTITAGSDSYGGPYLMAADGTYIGQISSGTYAYNLAAGTYFIGSGSKDKESLVTAMEFACCDDADVDVKVDAESGTPTQNQGGVSQGNGGASTPTDPNTDIDLSADRMLTFDGGASDPTGFFAVTANIKSEISSKTYGGVTYTSAIKMESSTSIEFTTSASKTLFIVTDTAGGAVKVDGVDCTANADGVVSVTLATGAHKVSKGVALNVYALLLK